jgi:hypothetical protein
MTRTFLLGKLLYKKCAEPEKSKPKVLIRNVEMATR